jgi:hypothetical protein
VFSGRHELGTHISEDDILQGFALIYSAALSDSRSRDCSLEKWNSIHVRGSLHSTGSRLALVCTKQTPWPLVRKRTIPTERPALVDEIFMPPFVDRGVSRGQRCGSPTVINLSFLDRSR